MVASIPKTVTIPTLLNSSASLFEPLGSYSWVLNSKNAKYNSAKSTNGNDTLVGLFSTGITV